MPQDPPGGGDAADSKAASALGPVPTAEPQPAPPRPVPGRGPAGDTRRNHRVLAPTRAPEPQASPVESSPQGDDQVGNGPARSGIRARPVIAPTESPVRSDDQAPPEATAPQSLLQGRPDLGGPSSQPVPAPDDRPLGPQPYPPITAGDGFAPPAPDQPEAAPSPSSLAAAVIEPARPADAAPSAAAPSSVIVPEERPARPVSSPVAPGTQGWEPTEPPPVDGRSRRAPRARVRIRARRVKRIIRRIDLWSVLKLSLMLYTCLYVATLVTLAVLWSIAYSTGMVEKLQSFLSDVGLDNFRFYGDQMFRASAAVGAVLVLAGTLITVLAVALINLISELTGGIRVTVIEEEPWVGDHGG